MTTDKQAGASPVEARPGQEAASVARRESDHVAPLASVCSWAACKERATERSGEWDFCARHAAADRALAEDDDVEEEFVSDDFLAPEANGHGTSRRAMEHRRDGEKPCQSCLAAESRAAADREARKRMTTPTGSPIAALLERANGHHSPKVKRLGSKIEGLLDDLRLAIKESEAEEAARQKIARLEADLAEAKAALKRGSKVTTIKRERSEVDGRSLPLECRKGCGTVSKGGQGRAAHERVCQYEAAAAS